MVAYSSITVLECGKALITTHERWQEKVWDVIVSILFGKQL